MNVYDNMVNERSPTQKNSVSGSIDEIWKQTNPSTSMVAEMRVVTWEESELSWLGRGRELSGYGMFLVEMWVTWVYAFIPNSLKYTLT